MLDDLRVVNRFLIAKLERRLVLVNVAIAVAFIVSVLLGVVWGTDVTHWDIALASHWLSDWGHILLLGVCV